ncbi:helix-turn-helix domain-containing protein [Actinacidiphila glaucinigra]|uniref:helix-turn-helix domain-containing protein n=1 Tax=Actinacidiphila glaucinigra TaxID=235986 RepID=UPI00382DB234
MTQTAKPSLSQRRATVRHLADQGMSARAIGAHLGISKDTVRRDLAATAQSGARQDEPRQPCPLLGAAPPVGWLTIPVDDDLHDHLAVLLAGGHTVTDAIRRSTELLADAYRTAWDYADLPRGVRPDVICRPVIPATT